MTRLRLRLVVRVVVALLALAAASPRASSDPPAVTREEVGRLLADVASDRYQVREAARRRLESVARAAKPFLLERREDPDPEVRRTVARLLTLVGDEGGTPPASAEGARSVGLVTLSFRGPLAGALAALDGVSPGRVRLPPSAGETPVAVDARSRPYFEVLDAMLSSERLEVAEGGFDGAGQATAAPVDPDPLAAPVYDGPFRLDVHSVSSTRTAGRGKASRTTIGLRLRWSPSIQLLSYEPAIVASAVDPSGRPVRAVETQPGGMIGFAPYGRQIGGGTASGLGVSLEVAPDASADRLATLDVRVKATLRRDRREARFDVGGTPKLPATVDVPGPERERPTRVTLESFGPDPERHGVWNVVVTVVLPKGVGGGAVSPCIESSDGTLRSTFSTGTRVVASDGTLRLSERVQGLSSEAGATAVRVVWFEREESVVLAFTLKDVPLR